jgi:EAL domain-containing protein (putative c-di-GMP-specific phosphodiesterase class I)
MNMKKMTTRIEEEQGHTNSFERLRNAFESTLSGLDRSTLTSDMSKAFETDAFHNGFSFEPIYGKTGVLFVEALARPHSEGRSYPIQEFANQIYALEHHKDFDLFTLSNVLKHGKDYPAISVNIAPESLLDPLFCEAAIAIMDRYKRHPSGLVFEILEHDVDPARNTDHLRALRDSGLQFALDDFGARHEQDIELRSHFRRLQLFRPYVTNVKLDGGFIGGNSDSDLKDLIIVLKQAGPGTAIIAEHVSDFNHAQKLFDLGFDAVQGQRLKEQELDYHAKILPKYSQTLDLQLT